MPGRIDPADSFARALGLHRAGRLAEAAVLYESALAADPGHAEALQALGVLRAMQGRASEAVALLERALAARPGHAPTLGDLGAALLAAGRHEDALARFDRLAALAPGSPDVAYNRGLALKELGRPAEALAAFDRALALRPGDGEALGNRGGVLLALRRPAEALESYRRALAVAPSAAAHLNCGYALAALQRIEEALGEFNRALALAPGSVEIAYGRAEALRELGRAGEALAEYDRVLFAAPARVDARRGRADALAALGRLPDAIAEYDRVAAAPGAKPAERHDRDAALGRAVALRRAGFLWDGLAAAEARLVARAREPGSVVTSFTLLQVSDDPALQLACARSWWAAYRAAPPPPRLAPAVPPSRERIRVGYLSSDFRVHAMAMLCAGLFAAHDRARFEVFGYSIGADDGSALRRRIVGSFDGFDDLVRADDEAAARRIAADGIDVLVDLNGLTTHGRPRILERRPAPIQVSLPGYAGSNGMETLDYLIADRVVAPPGDERFCSEAVVRLPHCYLVTDRARPIAPARPSRAACGLPESGFVFACFNGAVKIGPRTFDSWMRLLAAVPGSALWLLGAGPAAEANLRREAAARGVDGARLAFAAMVEPDAHLARLALADLCLDTLPYNGHTTTADALWAGVPVVTSPGRAFAARVAASALHAAGLPELVAPDPEAGEALALALARDEARLAALRAKLAANRLTTPLFDTDGYARALERAFAAMVERARAGAPPAGFEVV